MYNTAKKVDVDWMPKSVIFLTPRRDSVNRVGWPFYRRRSDVQIYNSPPYTSIYNWISSTLRVNRIAAGYYYLLDNYFFFLPLPAGLLFRLGKDIPTSSSCLVLCNGQTDSGSIRMNHTRPPSYHLSFRLCLSHSLSLSVSVHSIFFVLLFFSFLVFICNSFLFRLLRISLIDSTSIPPACLAPLR